MWDLSSLTRGQTHIPCIARWILNPWTTREDSLSRVKSFDDFIVSEKMQVLDLQGCAQAGISLPPCAKVSLASLIGLFKSLVSPKSL